MWIAKATVAVRNNSKNKQTYLVKQTITCVRLIKDYFKLYLLSSS